MRRRLIAPLVAGLLALPFCALPAAAALLIQIDKSTQQMTVSEDGQLLYRWPVSTGIARYDTPSGAFKPFRMEKDHHSDEWDDAPMPYSIFFTKKGHAIHGTNHKSIGRPASHGCVRLSVQHAAILWKLVKQEKMANTEVVLSGRLPGAAPLVAHGAPPRRCVRTMTSPRRRRSAISAAGTTTASSAITAAMTTTSSRCRRRATSPTGVIAPTTAMTTARCRFRSFCSGGRFLSRDG